MSGQIVWNVIFVFVLLQVSQLDHLQDEDRCPLNASVHLTPLVLKSHCIYLCICCFEHSRSSATQPTV